MSLTQNVSEVAEDSIVMCKENANSRMMSTVMGICGYLSKCQYQIYFYYYEAAKAYVDVVVHVRSRSSMIYPFVMPLNQRKRGLLDVLSEMSSEELVPAPAQTVVEAVRTPQ